MIGALMSALPGLAGGGGGALNAASEMFGGQPLSSSGPVDVGVKTVQGDWNINTKDESPDYAMIAMFAVMALLVFKVVK